MKRSIMVLLVCMALAMPLIARLSPTSSTPIIRASSSRSAT